jgi:four helix bundle protein
MGNGSANGSRTRAGQSFRDSIAWQRAMDLSTAVYSLTRDFPKEELFGLSSQLRRASISIASNIAEGQGRLTSGEFAHFLGMARGSALEVETQLELANRLGLGRLPELQQVQGLATEVTKILNAVLSNLRRKRQEHPQQP